MPEATSGDAAIHYDLVDLTPPWRGAAGTVIFHHGLGFDGRIWQQWLPLLADRFRLVSLDARGHGRSTVPPPGHDWSFPQFARDLLAVADAVGAEQFHMVGESMGGAIAYYMAIHHPERLLTATAISAPHQGARVGHGIDDWGDVIGRDGMEGWSRMMMQARFRDGAIEPALHEWLHRMQVESAPHVAVEVARGMLRPMDHSAGLADIRTPLLLIDGEASPFVPVDLLLDLRRLAPHAELQVVAGARHGVVLSHAAQCCDVLRAFIARAAGTAGG